MLTPDRWIRIEQLFLAALKLPPYERDHFVADHTGDDPDLQRAVAGMVAHAAVGGERLGGVIGGVAQAVTIGDWIGRRVGAYRIVREVGRGGMGLVFEATRDDDEYRKTVAVKVVPAWRAGVALTERFRLERQILSDLDHPNIARFLDGGTEEDVPYVVMEYVDGVPITTYCTTHALDLQARLALFRQVCGAVQFAHESLVVHRDLKPANILVDERGVPKLLDFGIAKLLDPAGDGGVTTVAAGMWTPDFAAPEQIRGRPATTRTDVYQLGLVLYELLTAERAQVSDASSPLALDRSICDVECPRPSDRLVSRGDPAAARRLRGDLDTIVMTALRKEPHRRYESVAALSDDVGRYLEGRPILARPGSVAYRALKFTSRHRVGMTIAGLLAISVAGGVGTSLYEARRAERRFQDVRALANAFVFDVHDRIARLPGSTEARKSIVTTALTYLERLRTDAGSDDALARELAAAYLKIGDVQGNPLASNLGDTTGAIVSFTRAEELLAPLEQRGDRAARRQLVSVAHHTGTVRQAKGDVDDASAAYARAVDIGERLIAEAPDDRESLSELGDVYSERARLASTRRDAAATVHNAEQAMRIAQRLAALEPGNDDYQLNLSTAYNGLGAGRLANRELAAAADAFREAMAIRERLVAAHPTDTEYRRNLIIAYGNLGDVLGFRTGENLGDFAAAGAAFRKAVALAEAITRDDPADRRAVFDLASAKLRLGTTLAEIPAQRAEGLRELGEAEDLNGRLLAQEPDSDRYRYLALVIGRRIGDALAATGDTRNATRRLEAVRTAAPALFSGPSAANARQQLTLAETRLARLRERGR